MRRVGLGFPPDNIVRGTARLPLPQRITQAVYAQSQAARMPADALRLRGGPRRAYGYLASPQVFTRSLLQNAGGVNSPLSIAPGLRIANAPRLVNTTNGASAGM